MSTLVFTVGGIQKSRDTIEIERNITISNLQKKIEEKIVDLKNNGKLEKDLVMRSLMVGKTDLLNEDKDDLLDYFGFVNPTFKVDMVLVQSEDHKFGGSRRKRSRKARKSRKSKR